MQKVQTPWTSACKELNKKLRQYKGSPTSLSRESGVSYFAVRRFMLSGVHNRNENVEKLLLHFSISIDETANAGEKTLGELNNVLRDAWDGSEGHAELLAKLIQSTKSFKVEGRQKK